MKSSTKILGILVFSATLMSCTEIFFSEPQPKGIKPLEDGFAKIAGEYIGKDENTEEGDTVIITRDEIIFPEEDEMDGELSEKVVVKKYKGRYFLNFKNEERGLWQLVVVNVNEDGDLYVTSLMNIDEDDEEELTKKNFAKLIEDEDEDDYIIMNPSKRKLMKLIEYPVFDDNKLDLSRIKIDK